MDTAVSHGSAVPVKINGIPQHARQVTGGGFHSLVLLSNHTLVAFGNNTFGELGVGDFNSRYLPTTVAGLTNVTIVSGGWQHSVALRADSTVWTWGKNWEGELGTGDTINRNIPTQVAGLNKIISVSGGDRNTVALRSDGTVWAWGDNAKGECGDGTKIQRRTPVQVTGLSNVIYVTARDYHNVAIKSDGSVWAWGWDINGQCGIGSNNDTLWIPHEVVGLGCATTGLASEENPKACKIYPNPVTNTLTIESLQNSTIDILTIQGRLIKTFSTEGNKAIIDVSSFSCGVYIVEIKTEKGIEVRKFVKE